MARARRKTAGKTFNIKDTEVPKTAWGDHPSTGYPYFPLQLPGGRFGEGGRSLAPKPRAWFATTFTHDGPRWYSVASIYPIQLGNTRLRLTSARAYTTTSYSVRRCAGALANESEAGGDERRVWGVLYGMLLSFRAVTLRAGETPRYPKDQHEAFSVVFCQGRGANQGGRLWMVKRHGASWTPDPGLGIVGRTLGLRTWDEVLDHFRFQMT